jgi:hypothetical protein
MRGLLYQRANGRWSRERGREGESVVGELNGMTLFNTKREQWQRKWKEGGCGRVEELVMSGVGVVSFCCYCLCYWCEARD